MEEGQKRLNQLTEYIKSNESFLYLAQRRRDIINYRLKEIEKKMTSLSSNASAPGSQPPFSSLVAKPVLASFLLDKAKPLTLGDYYTNEEIGILFLLWMHLADFQDVYDLSISDTRSIFIFYEQLKTLSSEGASCEDISTLSRQSLNTYNRYCYICITILNTILRDFKEPNQEEPEEENEENAPLKEDSPISSFYAFLFQNLDINHDCVSTTDWFYVAAMMFWSYAENPGIPCTVALVEQMKDCFERARGVPVWKWDSKWMVVVLLALCVIATESSQIIDEIEARIERRKQRVKERSEKKKSTFEAKEPPAQQAEAKDVQAPPTEKAEVLVPDPSFSEEQKKYVEELMQLVEAKKVDEVRVGLNMSAED